MKRVFFLSAVALLAAGPVFAQLPDTAPLDPRQLIEALKQLKEQNEASVKSRRMNAYQQVAGAASSPERAVAFWKEAVKSVQFEGAEKEGSQIRDWREGDGEALNDRLAGIAVRLHLNWLALQLQHAAGTETKALLPKVIEHVTSVQNANEMAEQFAENIQKAKERANNTPGARKVVQEDGVVKRVYDGIMRQSVSGSPVSRWLQLGDILDRKKEGGGWEMVPGNVDGIYSTVILPEFRASKDPRLLEYWDMVLKREGEKVAKRKLDIDERDWNQVKRPAILWDRAQDVLLLGQKNRAIGEMFNIVKTYPQHPQASRWITQLETLILPPATTTPGIPAPTVPGTPGVPAAPTAPSAPAVPAPAPVPSATATPALVPATAAGGVRLPR